MEMLRAKHTNHGLIIGGFIKSTSIKEVNKFRNKQDSRLTFIYHVLEPTPLTHSHNIFALRQKVFWTKVLEGKKHSFTSNMPFP
jgi:hypothetical protein